MNYTSRQLRPIHHRRMNTTKKDECSYSFSNAIRTLVMASEVGFEPTDGCPPPVFRAGAINHSATPTCMGGFWFHIRGRTTKLPGQAGFNRGAARSPCCCPGSGITLRISAADFIFVAAGVESPASGSYHLSSRLHYICIKKLQMAPGTDPQHRAAYCQACLVRYIHTPLCVIRERE